MRGVIGGVQAFSMSHSVIQLFVAIKLHAALHSIRQASTQVRSHFANIRKQAVSIWGPSLCCQSLLLPLTLVVSNQCRDVTSCRILIIGLLHTGICEDADYHTLAAAVDSLARRSGCVREKVEWNPASDGDLFRWPCPVAIGPTATAVHTKL